MSMESNAVATRASAAQVSLVAAAQEAASREIEIPTTIPHPGIGLESRGHRELTTRAEAGEVIDAINRFSGTEDLYFTHRGLQERIDAAAEVVASTGLESDRNLIMEARRANAKGLSYHDESQQNIFFRLLDPIGTTMGALGGVWSLLFMATNPTLALTVGLISLTSAGIGLGRMLYRYFQQRNVNREIQDALVAVLDRAQEIQTERRTARQTVRPALLEPAAISATRPSGAAAA